MKILISNHQDIPVDLKVIKELATFTLKKEKVSPKTELSIALVDQETIKELNVKYRYKNGVTDVLSFPLADEGDFLLGEVVIAPAVAKSNAKVFKISLDDEINLLLVHGLLHLVGHDHQKDKEARIMRKREKEILSSFLEGL